MITVYLNRQTGEAFACDSPDAETHLRKTLFEEGRRREDQFERLAVGTVRFRAINAQKLDVTTLDGPPNIFV